MTCVRKIGSGSQIRAGLSGYVAELIPAILATFLDSDRGFAKAREEARRGSR